MTEKNLPISREQLIYENRGSLFNYLIEKRIGRTIVDDIIECTIIKNLNELIQR